MLGLGVGVGVDDGADSVRGVGVGVDGVGICAGVEVGSLDGVDTGEAVGAGSGPTFCISFSRDGKGGATAVQPINTSSSSTGMSSLDKGTPS